MPSQLRGPIPCYMLNMVIAGRRPWYDVIYMKSSRNFKTCSTHQWIVTLFLTWLTTLISSLSPSLAIILGPGNCPFTVTMLFVWHNLVTFFILICKTKKIKLGPKYNVCMWQIKIKKQNFMLSYHITYVLLFNKSYFSYSMSYMIESVFFLKKYRL